MANDCSARMIICDKGDGFQHHKVTSKHCLCSITISMWLNPEDLGSNPAIRCLRQTGPIRYSLVTYSTSLILFTLVILQSWFIRWHRVGDIYSLLPFNLEVVRPSHRSQSNVTRSILLLPPCSIHWMRGCRTYCDWLANKKPHYVAPIGISKLWSSSKYDVKIRAKNHFLLKHY